MANGAMSAPTIKTAQSNAWKEVSNRGIAFSRCTYSAVSSAAAGIEGRMYPGSLAREILKKTIGTTIQINRKIGKPSSESVSIVIGSEFAGCVFTRHLFHAFFPASIRAGTANNVHGTVARRKTGM